MASKKRSGGPGSDFGSLGKMAPAKRDTAKKMAKTAVSRSYDPMKYAKGAKAPSAMDPMKYVGSSSKARNAESKRLTAQGVSEAKARLKVIAGQKKMNPGTGIVVPKKQEKQLKKFVKKYGK